MKKILALLIVAGALSAAPAEAGKLRALARKAGALGLCAVKLPIHIVAGIGAGIAANAFALMWQLDTIDQEER